MGVLIQRAVIAGAILWAVMAEPVTAIAAPQGQKIGVTAIVRNTVSGTLGNNIRNLQVRDGVFFEELIRTGPEGRTQFLFLDETVLSMGPESELALDSMVYDPVTNAGEMVVNVTLGFFRFVSGTMRSTAYRIRTPTTDIGIRGTIFDMIVSPEGDTTVIVEEGEVSMTVIETGQAVTVPAGQASTIEVKATRPTKPSTPPPALIQQVKSALTLTKTGTDTIPQVTPGNADSGSTTEETSPQDETPVDTQIISESADEVGQTGSQGTHSTAPSYPY